MARTRPDIFDDLEPINTASGIEIEDQHDSQLPHGQKRPRSTSSFDYKDEEEQQPPQKKSRRQYEEDSSAKIIAELREKIDQKDALIQSQSRNLDELESAIKEMKKQQENEKLNFQKNAQKDSEILQHVLTIDKLKKEVDELKKEQKDNTRQIYEKSMLIQNSEQIMCRLSTTLDESKKEITDLSEKNSRHEKTISKLQFAVEDIEIENSSLEQQIREKEIINILLKGQLAKHTLLSLARLPSIFLPPVPNQLTEVTLNTSALISQSSGAIFSQRN